jgi:hypothetical protein
MRSFYCQRVSKAGSSGGFHTGLAETLSCSACCLPLLDISRISTVAFSRFLIHSMSKHKDHPHSDSDLLVNRNVMSKFESCSDFGRINGMLFFSVIWRTFDGTKVAS